MSSEYSWTTKYILSLTIGEIRWRLKAISKRTNVKIKYDCKLHGLEFAGSAENKEQPVNLSSQQEDAIRQAQLRSMARKKKEFHG